MNIEARIISTTFTKSNPLAYLLSNSFSTAYYAETFLASKFTQSTFLKSHYSSLKLLWNYIVLFNAQGSCLAALTKDNYLLIIDTAKNTIEYIKMHILESISVCSISLLDLYIVIGGICHLLLINTHTKAMLIIDYHVPSNIVKLNMNLYEQKSLSKDLMNKPYSADFHPIIIRNTLVVKGIIGVLYGNKDDMIQIIKIQYINSLTMTEEFINVEYKREDKGEKTIIVKADSVCDNCIIALNSSNKYYSQVLLFDSNSKNYKRLQYLSFVSVNDCLPCDEYGRTSMIVKNIAWTNNNLYAVLLFSDNYFCIVSCFGYPLKLLPNSSNFLLVSRMGEYGFVEVKERIIYVFGSDTNAVVSYEIKGVKETLRFALKFPNLKVNLLKSLRDTFNRDITHFYPIEDLPIDFSRKSSARQMSDSIIFRNPFSIEPNIEIECILQSGFNLIESLRWSNKIQSNLLELVFIELNNFFRLIYSKNDPLYYIGLLGAFNKLVQEPMYDLLIETTEVYGIKRKIIENKERVLFNSERQKAFIMFYWLIQFRNIKASNFNVLHLVSAGIWKQRLRNQRGFMDSIKTCISILKYNKSFKLSKKQDFFDTKSSDPLIDRGLVYQLIFEYNENLNSDNQSEDEELVNEGMKSKQDHLAICAEFAREGKYIAAFKVVQELLKVSYSIDDLTNDMKKAIYIKAHSCLLLIGLTLLKGHTIKLNEVPTFLCKVLYKEDILVVFDQLKENLNVLKKEQSVKLNEEVNVGVGVLLKIGKDKLAIRILTDSLDPSHILLGLLILNNKINEVVNEDYAKESKKEYMNLLVSTIDKLLKQFPSFLCKNPNTLELFEVCVLESGEVMGSTIICLVLPWIVFHLEGLLQKHDEIEIKHTEEDIEVSDLMVKIANTSFNSPIEQCNKVLKNILPNKKQNNIFNRLLQISLKLLSTSIVKNIIELGDFSETEYLITPKDNPLKIRTSISSLLMVIWKLGLLISIEGLKETAWDRLKFAGNIIRLSSVALNDEQRIEYITQGFLVLSSINYSTLGSCKGKEQIIKEVNNALKIHTSTWDVFIKAEKVALLSLLKSSNTEMCEMLRESLGGYLGTQKSELNADIVFCHFLRTVFELLGKHVTVNSKDKEIREELRRIIDQVSPLTGIGKDMMMMEEEDNWKLIKKDPFTKYNDTVTKRDLQILSIIAKHSNIPNKQYFTEHIILDTNSTSNKSFTPFNTKTNVLPINNKRLKLKKKVKKNMMQSMLEYELMIEKLSKICFRRISKIIKAMSKFKATSMLKMKTSALVPTKPSKHKRALSLMVEGSDCVKSFTLYSIKREKLSASMVNMNATPRTQINTHSQSFTKETLLNPQKFFVFFLLTA